MYIVSRIMMDGDRSGRQGSTQRTYGKMEPLHRGTTKGKYKKVKFQYSL